MIFPPKIGYPLFNIAAALFNFEISNISVAEFPQDGETIE